MSDDNKIAAMQKKLLDELIEKKGFLSESVKEAFLAVPRHLFLPGVELEKVYSDVPIVTKWRDKIPLSSSSQPLAISTMLEQLELKKGLKVLEIGAGTGFNAALMANMVGEKGRVITVDIDKDIADSAKSNLKSAGFDNVTVVIGDGSEGYETEAPFDRIILTAAAWEVLPAWHEQLKPGGLLVIPMLMRLDQMTIALRRINDHLDSSSTSSCKFMPLQKHNFEGIPNLNLNPDKNFILMSSRMLKMTGKEICMMLDKSYTDYPAVSAVNKKDIQNGLIPLLDITEKSICMLGTTGENAEKMKMNMLIVTDREFGCASPALVGTGNICMILKDDPKTESPDLCVRNYGEDDTLAMHLVERIKGWDNAGRPTIHDICVKIYFDNFPKPARDESIIKKRKCRIYFKLR